MLSKKEILDIVELGNSKTNTNNSIDYHKHKQMIEKYNRHDIKRINKLMPDNPATEIIKQHDSTYAQSKLRHKYYSRQLHNPQII
jgi:arsenate reductase-like glutaredoxin family protein